MKPRVLEQWYAGVIEMEFSLARERHDHTRIARKRTAGDDPDDDRSRGDPATVSRDPGKLCEGQHDRVVYRSNDRGYSGGGVSWRGLLVLGASSQTADCQNGDDKATCDEMELPLVVWRNRAGGRFAVLRMRFWTPTVDRRILTSESDGIARCADVGSTLWIASIANERQFRQATRIASHSGCR